MKPTRVPIGTVKEWSREDLAELSSVTADEIDDAQTLWRVATKGTGLEDLLDAVESEENA